MANNLPQFGWATGPPVETSIYYPQGSILVNSAPTEGAAEKWICVSAGFPGTWIVGSYIGGSGGSGSSTIYLGDASTNGSWRLTVSGGNLIVQYRAAGSWVDKGVFEP